MTNEQALKVTDELWGEYGNVTPMADYSGRGMYGKTVGAIGVDDSAGLVPVLLDIGRLWAELDLPPADRPKNYDSLGNGYVVY